MGRLGKYFLYLLGAFSVGVALGVAYAYAYPEKTGEFIERLARDIGPISKDPFQNFLKIFIHNSWVALLILVSGLFFGLGPWIFVLFNGGVVGVVSGFFIQMGFPAKKLLLGLVPHGIIEVPAFLLSGAAGIEWYRCIRDAESPGAGFKRGTIKALKIYLLTVGLLLIAALIEAYVTPRVAGLG